MLKGKAMVALVSAVSAFVAFALAAVGITFAWYSTHTAQQTGFELNANGVMVVLFDDANVVFDHDLVPAVSVKDEITDNVTDFGDVTDEDNPLLVSPATVAHGTTYVEYLNSSSSDPENYGSIGADVRLQVSAKLVFGGNDDALADDDDPTNDENDDIPLSILRDLSITPTVTVTYLDGVTATAYPSVTFGSELTETFHVTGDCRIQIELAIYFREVDDLINPHILQALRAAPGANPLVISIDTVFEPDDE